MKKVIIDGNVYWYNRKIAFLFFDYKMKRQVPLSMFSHRQYIEFKKQLQ
jgi:hypothetical protein